MKKNRAIKNLLIDLVCACAALMVFALFHHVLPRAGQSLEIVIPQPSVLEQGDSSASTDPVQGSMPIAPARVKDTFSGTARDGKQSSKGTEKRN